MQILNSRLVCSGPPSKALMPSPFKNVALSLSRFLAEMSPLSTSEFLVPHINP
jgi:hypothetical protein